ncbi:MAG TPA: hypothetical protein VMM35_02420 [Longimicrobiales bacterium]|nr:hypothetical protein [Longimicrobiales bacterium]
MFRRISAAAAALLIAVPLAAQAPDGWQSRVDRSTNVSDPDDVPEVTITPVANGFEVRTGPAVTLYDPSNTATGSYTLESRFTLLQPSGHVNYYGLIYGGQNLDSDNQSYLYFLIGQNGTFVIRHRAGNETVHDIMGRTPHSAIVQPDANGQSVNTLQVRVNPEETQFLVNGTVVHTAPGQGMAGATDGVYGVRINHVIPGVRVENLRVTRM